MEKNNINTDHLVKDILRKSTVQEPSGDFTNNVMAQISTLKPLWEIEYKPIISRTAWFLLGIFVLLSMTIIIIASSLTPGDGARHLTYGPDIEMFTNTIGLYINSLFSGIKIPMLIPLGLGFVLFALFIEPFFKWIFKTKNPI